MDAQEQFLQQFNDVSKGVSKYITLDVLQIGIPYEITRFRLHDSMYGRCLIVDLAAGFWLVLPKRIGDLVSTEEQVNLLNSKKYWLVFKGRHEQYRKMAVIEFKTMEQYLMEQVEATEDMPLVHFAVHDMQNGTILKEVGIQTEEIQINGAGEQPQQPLEEPKQDESKAEGIPKSGAAPKVTIKVKKERK